MKILVAVDGSKYTRRMVAYLAAHDEWLGDRHQYTLIHAVAPLPSRAVVVLDPAVLKSYYEAAAERVFKPLRVFFNKQGLSAQFVAKVGHPAHVISDAAKKGKFDLLMLGSHGHGTLANLVMGSVATKVLANCSTPALLVR